MKCVASDLLDLGEHTARTAKRVMMLWISLPFLALAVLAGLMLLSELAAIAARRC